MYFNNDQINQLAFKGLFLWYLYLCRLLSDHEDERKDYEGEGVIP